MRFLRLGSLALGLALTAAAAPARAESSVDQPARPPSASSRFIALLPFGAGQFQNGDVARGAYFAAGELLLAGTSIGSYLYVAHLATTAVPASQFSSTNAHIATATVVNRVAFASWAALTLGGIIEAQISLAPKRAAVTATPTPGGALLGVRAAF
jgi:hypothetical protein